MARSLLTGAFAGTLALSALVTLLHYLLAPDLVRSPFYPAFWVFITGPFGAVLGGVAAAAAAHGRRYSAREAGLIRVTGGAVVAFLFGLALLWCLRLLLHDQMDWNSFVRVPLPLLGTPFAWALLMISHGSLNQSLSASDEE